MINNAQRVMQASLKQLEAAFAGHLIETFPELQSPKLQHIILEQFNSGFFSVRDYPLSFHSVLDVKSEERVLQEALPKTGMEPPMLYYHIPFCERGCTYCGFYHIVQRQEGLLDSYVNRLIEDTSYIRQKYGVCNPKTIYFGGGSPSILGGKRLARLVEGILKAVGDSKVREIAIEADPTHVTQSLIADLISVQASRISLGIQSFNDSHLVLLGRRHTKSQAVGAVKAALASNLQVSLDIMYGFPGITPDGLEETLETIGQLRPDQLSIYRFSLHSRTWMSKQFELSRLGYRPDLVLAQNPIIGRRLRDFGYVPFTTQDYTLSEADAYNLNTWLSQPYIGIGPGARSFVDKLHGSAVRSLRRFLNRDDRAHRFIEMYNVLSPDELQRRMIILAFKRGSLDSTAFRDIWKRAPDDVFPDEFQALTEMNLLESRGTDWVLTPIGRAVFWRVCEPFFSVTFRSDLQCERSIGTTMQYLDFAGVSLSNGIGLP